MIFDEQTKALVEAHIGSFDVIKNHRGDSNRTGVLEVSAQGQRLFVKIHNRLSRWHPEVFAYCNWMERLAPHAPAMVAKFNENECFGIITTAIEGQTVNEAQLEDEARLIEVYRNAGKLLRNIQENSAGTFFGQPAADGAPLGTATADPVVYIKDSLNSLFAACYDNRLTEYSHNRLLEWCLGNCDVFADDAPTPTNWDFSPNNWMVDKNGIFTGIIDFENMLWGLPLDSFGVVLERYAYNKPELAAALFEGYGLPSDEETAIKMKILAVKMAFADVLNGHLETNSRFSECGIRALADLTGKTDFR